MSRMGDAYIDRLNAEAEADWDAAILRGERPADYDAREEATIRYLIELDREAKIRQEAEDRAPLGWEAKL